MMQRLKMLLQKAVAPTLGVAAFWYTFSAFVSAGSIAGHMILQHLTWWDVLGGVTFGFGLQGVWACRMLDKSHKFSMELIEHNSALMNMVGAGIGEEIAQEMARIMSTEEQEERRLH